MFIEPIQLPASTFGFSGYIWLDTKIVLKNKQKTEASIVLRSTDEENYAGCWKLLDGIWNSGSMMSSLHRYQSVS